jgi:Zn-dependent protease
MGDPVTFTIALVVVLLALSIHEFAHAKFADMAGDPTPRLMGRVTLNPLAHLDPMGTLMILFTMTTGFGIGWGKPVMVNPLKMKNMRWDHFMSVLAGPMSNLVQAFIYAVLYKLFAQTDPSVELFLFFGISINLALCFFNLIPLGPLDGHWLVGAFLPIRQRERWYLWNRTVGGGVLLMVILFGQFFPQYSVIRHIIRPVITFFMRLLLGPSL